MFYHVVGGHFRAHWHGDTFALPDGATLLASTEQYPHQAFSMARSLALQFHLEADRDRIEQWLIGHSVEPADAGIDPADIRVATRKYGSALRQASTQALASWFDGSSRPDSGKNLGSTAFHPEI